MKKLKSIRILILLMAVVLLGGMTFNCDAVFAAETGDTEEAVLQGGPSDGETRNFTVEIEWSDGLGKHYYDDSCEVTLHQNDKVYARQDATATLDSSNSFKYTWGALPLKGNNDDYYKYTVTATAKDGYKHSIEYTQADGVNDSATVTYTLIRYDIKYVFCGEVPDDVNKYLPADDNAEHGSNYIAADTSSIKETGYTFRGWYTNPECTAEYVDGTPVKRDMTLYGYWDKKGSGDDDDDDDDDDNDNDVIGGTTSGGNGTGISTGDSSTLTLFLGMLFISLVEAMAVYTLKRMSR